MLRLLLLTIVLGTAGMAAAQPAAPAPAGTPLVLQLEEAAAAGNYAGVLSLGVRPDVPGLREFAASITPPPSRLVIKERDRTETDDGGVRLLLEVLAEADRSATITTWRVDLNRVEASGPAAGARIAGMEQVAVVSGLHRLLLDPTQQFEVRDLVVRAPDLTLEMPSGRAFAADVPGGHTAIVLLGRGRMRFAPDDEAERTQLRIFSGASVLDAEFDAAFLRLNPVDLDERLASGVLTPRPVAPRDLRRAQELFDEYVGQTFNLDLGDLSRDRWSLVPVPGDLIAEVRTRRYGNLTYARSGKDAEDITLFDRRRRRNISVYSSAAKLEARGRFYSEDALAEYDVLEYDVEAAFAPDRRWMDGQARLRLRIRAPSLTVLTLRLAEPLVVRGVVSPGYGRLLHLRVVGQNSVVINLPDAAMRGTEIELGIAYGGRIDSQRIEGEGVTVSAQEPMFDQVYIPIEPHFVYSNRSYWYPQAMVTDYATARLRISVPAEFTAIASGRPAGVDAAEDARGSRRVFTFVAADPVRYLACVISRFDGAGTRQIPVESTPGASGEDAVSLHVQANPRQRGRARELMDQTARMLAFYSSVMEAAPYAAFTLAVTESELPGGHSPAYFAMLNQPPPMSSLVWRNDPVAFDGYVPYFLAHEVAHQWWGQAVGWKNYHEQWLSEGFAQYFAVLYARHDRGEEQFASMLRQMRRWAMEHSAQGPVYLGYRLGHIRGDGRIFRALVYNKGAMVLHMLRRLVGDEAFFDGLRAFYREWRFRKAGTDDLRAAMESVSGRDLRPFFDAWIYASDLPTVRVTSEAAAGATTVRFEHLGAVVPVPLTMSVVYEDGRTVEQVVPVTGAVVEERLPPGTVRSIDVNRDHGALAEIVRR